MTKCTASPPYVTPEISDVEMLTAELVTTALIFAGVGALLTISVLSSRASAHLGVPVALLFLVVGMLAGSEGIGRIPFEDYSRTFRLGTGALCLILFDGGLHTSPRAIREVAAPAILLATIGVALTALIVAVAAHVVGYSWPNALLVGAIVSPTDAAAVFSAIASTGVRLRRRIELLLEVESGLNDPMAVILATALTVHAAGGGTLSIGGLVWEVVVQLLIGAILGAAIGWAGRWSVGRLNLPATGLYPAFTVGIAALAFALPTLAHGSGFLAVYVAGSALGAGELPEGEGIRRVHNALGDPPSCGGRTGHRHRARPGTGGAPSQRTRLPRALSVVAAGDGLRGVDGPSWRRADHPSHDSGAWRRSRGQGALRPGLLRRRRRSDRARRDNWLGGAAAGHRRSVGRAACAERAERLSCRIVPDPDAPL